MTHQAYSEAAYFDGFHFAHIAAWQEHLRLKRIDIKVRLLSSIARRPAIHRRLP